MWKRNENNDYGDLILKFLAARRGGEKDGERYQHAHSQKASEPTREVEICTWAVWTKYQKGTLRR